MASLDVIFATVVGVLAGLAVIGALAFVVVWEWYAIRRTLAAHRRQVPEGFWRDRGATSVPTIPRAEGALVRQHARRILNGETIRGLTHGRKWS